jgi:recombination protein RecT
MGDYLNSLEKLIQICGDERIEFILPAHGYVIGNFWARPRSAIDVAKGLHQHRLTREEKIYQTIQNNLSGTMQDWVQKAYDDVPSSIWPIAMRSLLAHVEHLKQTGRISSNIKV